jgi:hypothetical protein
MRSALRRYPLYLCSALAISGCVIQPWDAYFSADNQYAWPTDLLLDQAGRPVITGTAEDAEGELRHFVAKYSTSGKLLWSQLLSHPAYRFNVLVPREQQFATDSLGGVLASGLTPSGVDVTKLHLNLLKVTANGQQAWSVQINDLLISTPHQVAIDKDDCHWILTAVHGLYELRNYDASGHLQWQLALSEYSGFGLTSEHPMAHPIQFDLQGNAYVASGRSLLKISAEGSVLQAHDATDFGLAVIQDTHLRDERVLVGGVNATEERVYTWLNTDLQPQATQTLPAAQGWTQVSLLDADQVCFMTSEYSESDPIHYQIGALSATQGLLWQNSLNQSMYRFIPGKLIAADAHCHASRTEQPVEDYQSLHHIVTRHSATGEAQELVNHDIAYGAGFALRGNALYSLQVTHIASNPDRVQSWLARRSLEPSQ